MSARMSGGAHSIEEDALRRRGAYVECTIRKVPFLRWKIEVLKGCVKRRHPSFILVKNMNFHRSNL
ncbi:MAG: hypothetical protein VX085_04980, partial [Pseudomonadota bacterium]|nr:hypothetical protein [Pseudomonadota bacterium]